jgi:hypothetical protein
LLRFFRGCRLDEITTGMVEDFKLARSREKRKNANDGMSTPTATLVAGSEGLIIGRLSRDLSAGRFL